MSIKTLMLGWEFPPFISGGLGTACYGLTKAMSQQGMQVTFVLPGQKPLHFGGGQPGSRRGRWPGRCPTSASAPSRRA